MAVTYFDLIKQTAVILNVEEPTSFNNLSEPEYVKIKDSLNAINRHVCSLEQGRWNFRERRTTLNTVAGLAEYDLPDGIIKSVRVEGQLRPIPYEYEYTYQLENQSGEPDRYSVLNSKLMLYPTPDVDHANKVVTIEYYTNKFAKTLAGVDKSNMDSEGDTSIIPEQYRDVLVYGCARDWKGDPNRGKYQHFNARYQELLQNMRANIRRSENARPVIVNGLTGRDATKDLIDNFFSTRW